MSPCLQFFIHPLGFHPRQGTGPVHPLTEKSHVPELQILSPRLSEPGIDRTLCITYEDDCPSVWRPLHPSQAHLPDDQVALFPASSTTTSP